MKSDIDAQEPSHQIFLSSLCWIVEIALPIVCNVRGLHYIRHRLIAIINLLAEVMVCAVYFDRLLPVLAFGRDNSFGVFHLPAVDELHVR